MNSVFDTSSLEIPSKLILEIVFYFFLEDSNHTWEPLCEYNFLSRKEAEFQKEKIENLLRSSENIKLRKKIVNTKDLYLSEIRQEEKYYLVVDNYKLSLPNVIKVYLNSIVEKSFCFNLSELNFSNVEDIRICEFNDGIDFELICVDNKI